MTSVAFGSRRYWETRVGGIARTFEGAVQEHGYGFHPELRFLHEAEEAFFYYDPGRMTVSVSPPDLTTPVGRLRWIPFLRLTATLSIESAAAEVDSFLDLSVVHELCHHMRHIHGRMEATDHWTEEHAVNILMVSYLRSHPSCSEAQPRLLERLARMRAALDKLRDWELIEATHDDLEEVLHHDLGLISQEDYRNAFRLGDARRIPVMQVIRDDGLATETEIAQAADRRAQAKERYNAEYMKDIVVYWKLMVAQAQVELVDPDLPPFPEALRLVLGQPVRRG